VVIGDTGVLVVDSCYLPSSAREDIAQIKQWTDKPVRWLVNTHWHNDHVQGNNEYVKAFPGLNIVGHYETQSQVAGYVSRYPSRFPKIAATYKKYIDERKDGNGTVLSDNDIADYKKALAGKDVVLAELKDNVIVAPNVSFDHDFNVDLGNRQVQVKHLGRGNTRGDVVIFLPKERIVAAGDLLDSPVPYLGGGYPIEEIDTLKALSALEPQVIVPGHGDVLRDKILLNNLIEFLQTVTGEISKQIYVLGNGPRNLDEVRKNVMATLDLNKWRDKLAGPNQVDRDFFDSFSLAGVITAAYAESWGR
jgi:glyoxylase-like metal-dependent hydrolase (beta-lactamase superfamily II)